MATATDLPFFTLDVQNDFGQWATLNEPMGDPISRPPSARAHMLYGIGAGAGTNLHLDSLHIHSLYSEGLEFETYRMGDNAFPSHQKTQDLTFPPFDMALPHDGYQYDSPHSDDSSQSGESFSASCCTDDLNSQAMHQRLSISRPAMVQEPYFGPEFFPPTQSPQLPPGLGGGISLGEVQNFQDQIMDRNNDFQDSAYSEPDAEGESDREYPSVTAAAAEHVAKRPSRPGGIYKESFAELTQDSMSEDFEPDEEEDGDYHPRHGSVGRKGRAAGPRRNSHGRRTSNGTATGRITKSKTRKPSNASQIRPFPCPLAQYGCQSTFTSKNEWKRHVSTQHIKLGFWRCDMCTIGDHENPVYNDFNRKDLFTQHLRRMHRQHPRTISTVINDKGEPEISDEAMQAHQERCYVILRKNPMESTCLFCEKSFQGESSWEERMEHVGGHMERERKANRPVIPCEEWHEDHTLRDYLEEEGLIEYDNGKWAIGNGSPLRG